MAQQTTAEKLIVRNPHMKRYPEGIRERLFSDIQQNADTFMFNENSDNMDGIALTMFGITTTYAQLDKEVEQAARALYKYGIRKGDYVAMCLPNVKEVVVYYYALWRIGAIAVPTDPRTNAKGIVERIKLAKAKLLLTVLDIMTDKLEGIMDEIPCEHIIVTTPADSMSTFANFTALGANVLYARKKKKSGLSSNPRIIWHTDFLKDYTYDGEIRPEYEKDMDALILFTSGTSSDGVMKGAVHTHAGLNASAISTGFRTNGGRACGDEYRGLTFGGFIPFFTSYGVFNGMHMALYFRMNIIMVPVYNPLKFDELIFKYKPNGFMGVPRFFEILARSPLTQKPGNQLAFIHDGVIGGDKVTPASLREINACMARCGAKRGVRVGYGSTEVGAAVSGMEVYKPDASPDEYDWDAEGNVGLMVPALDALVIDPDTGEELPLGVDGELCISSLSMMKEYLGAPAETEEITLYRDGQKYYRMGDKGHMGENGAFYFVDRYKRSMMRPDGHTVHPSPVENVIATHPDVALCAVAGIKKKGDEEKAGVIPAAFIIVKKSAKITDKRAFLLEVDKLCLKELPERDKAIAYTIVDMLPHTLMGKVDFRELEKVPLVNEEFVVTDFAFFPELVQDKK